MLRLAVITFLATAKVQVPSMPSMMALMAPPWIRLVAAGDG